MPPILSIVIPCYNEARNIPLILNRFQEVIPQKDGHTIEIILVNNGSADQSKVILEQMIPRYSFARSVEVKVNQGYGYGILQGLKEARGEFLGWTHADLQTDPADIIKVMAILKENDFKKDIFIKGRRRGRPVFDEIFTVGMSIFETVYMGCPLADINAQPNVFPRDFFNSWVNPPYDFSLDLYALYMAKRKKFDVIRFDVTFPPRIHGRSSWNTGLNSKYKFIKRTMDYSFRLKKELSSHAV